MSEFVGGVAAPVKHHGWRVTFAGMGINLALGVLYTWSVISKGVPKEWNWSESAKSWPYAIACLVFSLIMVPAGRLQDHIIGPRMVATIGGILVGAGLILSALIGIYLPDYTLIGFIVGFGLLGGAGIGFGYASATPPAVKWFPAAKTGLIAGLVVSGFGLASVYAAPTAKWLTSAYSLPTMMLVFGVGFFVVVVGLAQILKPPPAGYVPPGSPPAKPPGPNARKEEFTPREMLRTWQFYMLWFMYACGAGAGLMVIAKLAAIAKVQARIELGFILVAVLAIGNGAGRIIAGIVSDKIGRKATMAICFVLQAVLVFLLSQTTEGSILAQTPVLAAISALIGASYGANLSVFPSVTKDYYGMKNFGVNYGLVFTAWGVGGFMLALLVGKVYDATQSFNFAYYCSAGLLVAAAGATYIVKQPHHQLKPSRSQSPLAAEPVRGGAYAKVPVPTRRKGPR